MKINTIRRPGEPKGQRRYNPDPFYQSGTWKRTKKAFKLGTSILPDGKEISNTLCYECAVEGKIRPGYAIDHVKRIKDGGDRTDHNNLRNLCESHHARKSAKEAQL